MNEERRNDCDDKRNIYDHLLRAHYRTSVATGVEKTEDVVHHIHCSLHILCVTSFDCLVWTRSLQNHQRGRCGRDHMVVGFTTTYAISIYHH